MFNAYLYNDSRYPQQMKSGGQGYAACMPGYGGQILELKNFAPGTYNIAVWNFPNTNDRFGKGIWKLKSWGSRARVGMEHRESPYG